LKKEQKRKALGNYKLYLGLGVYFRVEHLPSMCEALSSITRPGGAGRRIQNRNFKMKEKVEDIPQYTK
jgi:hypothetical protein